MGRLISSKNALFVKRICKGCAEEVSDVLKKFRIEGAKSTSTPMEVGLKLSKSENEKDVDSSLYRSLIGSLMYLTATRPDLTFSVSMLSRFMESSKKSHWEAGKRVLRYLCGTVDEGIFYRKVKDSSLVGYCDNDWGGSIDDCKSTSGYVFSIGSGAISWASNKQSVVALSTAESEYISLAFASCQDIWIKWIV